MTSHIIIKFLMIQCWVCLYVWCEIAIQFLTCDDPVFPLLLIEDAVLPPIYILDNFVTDSTVFVGPCFWTFLTFFSCYVFFFLICYHALDSIL